jgi:glutathione S-transferase
MATNTSTEGIMKLFIKAGACSLSPHIAVRELGLDCEIVPVDLAAKKLADGSDYRAVSPKGQVPALQLDDGQLLTEGQVIVQYLADCKPESGLMPPAGTLERYRVLEWLSFISTELHKSFSPLFRPNTPDAYKTIAKETIAAKLDIVEAALAGRQWLAADTFTVADGYGFTVTNWAAPMGIDLARWPNLVAWRARVGARPGVKAAMAEEGLG